MIVLFVYHYRESAPERIIFCTSDVCYNVGALRFSGVDGLGTTDTIDKYKCL